MFVISVSSLAYYVGICLFLLNVNVSGAQRYLTGARSDTRHLAKCHKGFLKHDINTWKNRMLFTLIYFYWINMNCIPCSVSNI